MPQNSNSRNLGWLGERLVAVWLQDRGWQILHHRWRCRWGELDLIAQNEQTIAFVEVKTRRAKNWDADGLLAIAPSKQAKLIQSAQLFLTEHPDFADCPCRFDVALVRGDRVVSHGGETTLPRSLALGQPACVGEYRLCLHDYIPAAFS